MSSDIPVAEHVEIREIKAEDVKSPEDVQALIAKYYSNFQDDWIMMATLYRQFGFADVAQEMIQKYTEEEEFIKSKGEAILKDLNEVIHEEYELQKEAIDHAMSQVGNAIEESTEKAGSVILEKAEEAVTEVIKEAGDAAAKVVVEVIEEVGKKILDSI